MTVWATAVEPAVRLPSMARKEEAVSIKPAGRVALALTAPTVERAQRVILSQRYKARRIIPVSISLNPRQVAPAAIAMVAMSAQQERPLPASHTPLNRESCTAALRRLVVKAEMAPAALVGVLGLLEQP